MLASVRLSLARRGHRCRCGETPSLALRGDETYASQSKLAPRALGRLGGVRGQATVELVALLPLVGLLVALLWQALLAGETVWLSGVAARAVAVGVDPVAAARGVLPARFERGLRVSRAPDGSVSLGLRVPMAVGGG